MQHLENEYLRVSVSPQGAELTAHFRQEEPSGTPLGREPRRLAAARAHPVSHRRAAAGEPLHLGGKNLLPAAARLCTGSALHVEAQDRENGFL